MRHDPAVHLDRHRRARDIIALVKRLPERHEVAGEQCQLDIAPGLAGEVLKDGPALQPAGVRLPVGRQAQPVSALPQRRPGDIADADPAGPGAAAVQRQAAELVSTLSRHLRQRGHQPLLQFRIDKGDHADIVEHHLSQPGIGHQHQPKARQRHIIGTTLSLRVDMHEAPRRRLRPVDAQFSPGQPVEQIGQ